MLGGSGDGSRRRTAAFGIMDAGAFTGDAAGAVRRSLQRRIVAHFDRMAQRYDADIPAPIRSALLARRAALVTSLLARRPGARVLDLGCGTGRLVHRLRRMGVKADGADVSRAMLDIARAGHGRFFMADAVSPRLPAGRYDAALCFGLLHHLAEARRVRRALREMVRLVRPGGLVLAGENNPLNPYWRWLMHRLPVDQVPTRLVHPAEIVRALARAGARVRWIRFMGWTPDFAPAALIPVFALVERALERLPIVRRFSAFHLVLAERIR